MNFSPILLINEHLHLSIEPICFHVNPKETAGSNGQHVGLRAVWWMDENPILS
jgi:hypothetical protein